MWAVTAPETYELLVLRRGWSLERFADHIDNTVLGLLRSEATPERGHSGVTHVGSHVARPPGPTYSPNEIRRLPSVSTTGGGGFQGTW